MEAHLRDAHPDWQLTTDLDPRVQAAFQSKITISGVEETRIGIPEKALDVPESAETTAEVSAGDKRRALESPADTPRRPRIRRVGQDDEGQNYFAASSWRGRHAAGQAVGVIIKLVEMAWVGSQHCVPSPSCRSFIEGLMRRWYGRKRRSSGGRGEICDNFAAPLLFDAAISPRRAVVCGAVKRWMRRVSATTRHTSYLPRRFIPRTRYTCGAVLAEWVYSALGSPFTIPAILVFYGLILIYLLVSVYHLANTEDASTRRRRTRLVPYYNSEGHRVCAPSFGRGSSIIDNSIAVVGRLPGRSPQLIRCHFTPQQLEDTSQLAIYWVGDQLSGKQGSPTAATPEKGKVSRFQCAGVVACESKVCLTQIAPGANIARQVQSECTCGLKLRHRSCKVEWLIIQYRGGAVFECNQTHSHSRYTHSLSTPKSKPAQLRSFISRQPVSLISSQPPESLNLRRADSPQSSVPQRDEGDFKFLLVLSCANMRFEANQRLQIARYQNPPNCKVPKAILPQNAETNSDHERMIDPDAD
ncbi:hypothetical protein R3P38DRAFT_3567065 [Favolaschia claudopus]|uniref:RING-CH-type domain-containing protein n=1 Tax=Favolaschia claudopus TaxID=2862362 RepID=A0AAW0AU08_9AGAR